MIFEKAKTYRKCLYFVMKLCYNKYTDKLQPDSEMYDNGKKQDQLIASTSSTGADCGRLMINDSYYRRYSRPP